MKKLFIFALLANLGLFGWYAFGRKPETTAPDNPELHADQIRIISENEIPASVPAVAPEQPASTPAPVATEETVASTPTTPAAPAQLACFTLGPVADADWIAVKPKLRELKLTPLKPTVEESASKYWVYIPPLGSQDLAQRKASQLTALGVTEYFVIQDGSKWQNAISLGIFSSKEAADKQLLTLQDQGVRSAVVRPREPIIRNWSAEFRKLDEARSNQLKQIAKTLAGATLSKQECAKK